MFVLQPVSPVLHFGRNRIGETGFGPYEICYIIMNLKEVCAQIQHHAEAALALLPPTIVPFPPPFTLARLQEEVNRKNWGQVLGILDGWRRENTFSDELLQHLSATSELFKLHDQLTTKAALMQLTDAEKKVIGECLRATAFGPFFPDWEFPSLFGTKRKEVIKIVEAWPEINNMDMGVGSVINDSINHLFGYPHHKQNEWFNYISVSPQELYAVYNKFRALTGRPNNQQTTTSALEYFQNIAG